MVLAVSSGAFALILTVGNGTGEPGQTIPIAITVDNPTGIAGAAFTIEYDTNSLTVFVDSALFDTFANQWIGTPNPQAPTSVLVDGVTYTEPVIANEVATGIRIAAARCTPAGASPATLFTLNVQSKPGAQYKKYDIKVVPTVLTNTAAGYSAQGETIPMLVGADATKEVTDPLAFPVLLPANGNVVQGSFTLTPPDTDKDGIPDDWEIAKFGNLSTATATSDYDKDGYSDRQEYLNGASYDPKVQDPVGGTGYNPATDNRAPHFASPAGTNNWEDYYGNLTVAGAAAQTGDEVAVFAGDFLVGRFVVTTVGKYGFLHVYGESTPGAGDGASIGEALSFKIWDKSTMIEYSAKATVTDGSGSPPEYDGGFVKKSVDLETVTSQRIPLRAGWNLVSFSVNVCTYDSDNSPNVNMISGVQYQKVQSIGDVLSSIAGKYTTVSSFDKDFAHTFDPDPAMADFNDLHYLAPGYGYWIKMSEAAVLEIDGSRVSPSGAIVLNPGWNLVGYWPDVGKHDCPNVPAVDLPEDACFEKIDSIKTVIHSIDGKYTTVSSFDKDYAHTFDPDPAMADFNDLHYMAPGYGYWIKMTETGTLTY